MLQPGSPVEAYRFGDTVLQQARGGWISSPPFFLTTGFSNAISEGFSELGQSSGESLIARFQPFAIASCKRIRKDERRDHARGDQFLHVCGPRKSTPQHSFIAT